MDALKLRIDTGVRKIEVNDNGDYIMLQVADQSIPAKLKKFVKAATDKLNKLSELSESENEADTEAAEELAYELDVFAKASIDDIFGDGTCKKVFGDIVPPIEMYIEFIEAITPYFQEYALNRAKKLSKYSPNRMGSAE